MNPNNQVKVDSSENSQGQTQDSNQLPQPNNAPGPDDIFVIKPPEKQPLDKKSITLVAVLAIVGAVVLLAVGTFALVGSADGLANDYRRLESIQIKKISPSLEALEPGAVINQRNLDEPLGKISLSEQSQPSLENVLFIGSLSDRYQSTEKVQTAANKHYANIKIYGEQLEQLLSFDSSIQTIFDQEPDLSAVLDTDDPFSIRSISGSYENYVKKMKATPAPLQIENLKNELVELYEDKATTYLAWANVLEEGDAAAVTAAQQEISVASTKAVALSDDQNYVDSFTPSYQKLLTEHKLLKQLLDS